MNRPWRRREKAFGDGLCIPRDRNAKIRIEAQARAYNAQNRHGRQHRGPLTVRALEVLNVLLWSFHNSETGRCFPSYEAIAAKVKAKYGSCARSTVAEALKALEAAGVLTWQHRITRIQERARDLFGHWASRWRVIRTSNAYQLHDPTPQPVGVSSKSENPAGTRIQESSLFVPATQHVADALEQAAIESRDRQLRLLGFGHLAAAT